MTEEKFTKEVKMLKAEIENIKAEDNVVKKCPECESERIIKGTKKWKCMDCHKSFKVPNHFKIIEQEVKECETELNLKDNKDLQEFIINKVPSIDALTIDKEGNNSLITNSKEIENMIQTEKNEIISQIQKEKEEISDNIQSWGNLGKVKLILKTKIPNNIKACGSNGSSKEMSSKSSEIFIKSDLPSMSELLDKLETTEIPKIETTEIPKLVKKRIIIRKKQ